MARDEADVLQQLKSSQGPIEGLTRAMLTLLSENLLGDEDVRDGFVANRRTNVFTANVAGIATPSWSTAKEIRYLFAITDVRVIAVSEYTFGGGFFGSDRISDEIVSVAWDDIEDVVLKAEERRLDVYVRGRNNPRIEANFWHEQLPEPRLVRFAEQIQERAAKAKQAPSAATAENRFIDQLERLTSLREKGAITEEEFVLAKRKLLSE